MNFIVYDLEATCDEPNDDWAMETIEIGAVKYRNTSSGLVLIDTFDRFIQPVLNPTLTDYCKALTSIQQEDINNADMYYDVIKGFQKWISDNGTSDYLLCSWGFYDRSQLVQDCTLHGLDSWFLKKKHISLKHQYANIPNKKLRGIKGVFEVEGLIWEGHQHRGIVDAKNTGKIFTKFFEQWHFDKAR